MVCPNCQSNDIVELQNQHFCINCGRLIELTVKKRGVGRPKADRLDKPKPLTIKLAGRAVVSVLDKPTTSLTDTVNVPAEGTSVDQATISAPDDNEVVDNIATSETNTDVPLISRKFNSNAPASNIKIRKFSPAHVSSEKEIQLTEAKARKRIQDIVPTTSNMEAGQDIPNIIKPKPKRLALSAIINASWSEPWQGGPARVLFLSSVIAAAFAGGAAAVIIFSPEVFNNLASQLGSVAIILSVALLFGVANTERAAFALRRYDHRPIPRSWLFGGALAVIGRQTGVLIAGIIDLTIVAGLSYFVAKTLPNIVDQPYTGVILLATYFILTILLLAVWVKTGLAAAGVELGRMSVLDSLKFGWISLWKHPELLGTRLVAALWLAASLAGIVAIGYVTHLYLPGYDLGTIILTSSVLVFTAIMLGNFGSVGWRQACYRELVILDRPEAAIGLLSSHHNGAPSKSAKMIYIIVVGALMIGGILSIFSSFQR